MKSLRFALLLALACVAILSAAGGAYAAPTTQLLFLTSSPGDTGYWFGNYAQFANLLEWYDQTMSIVSTPTLYDYTAHGSITLNGFAYNYNGSAFTSATANPLITFKAEGMYTLVAAGVDASGTAFEGTTTIGIDRTRPTSTSNAVPVYDDLARITIRENDALSGPEYIVYSVDQQSDYATPTVPPRSTATLSRDVVVTTPGRHTLSWFTVDYAGNHERPHQVSFRVNAAGYVPYLNTPRTHANDLTVKIWGNVTPATTRKTVVLTVQRKSGGSWKAYKTYRTSVAKWSDHYQVRNHFGRSGTFRVRAAEGSGRSRWKTFKI